MTDDPRSLRRSRARRRAELRREAVQARLVELDARYREVAVAAALHASARGRGPRALRRSA